VVGFERGGLEKRLVNKGSSDKPGLVTIGDCCAEMLVYEEVGIYWEAYDEYIDVSLLDG
jgi:hypothetical protein